MQENTEQSRSAINSIGQAYYYQSNLNTQIEPILKDIEKKYVPNNLKKLGTGLTFIHKLVKDNKVEFSWTFE